MEESSQQLYLKVQGDKRTAGYNTIDGQSMSMRRRAKLHYTDTGYGRARNNSATNLPHRNAVAQHLDMSRCWDVANFCPLVVNLLYNKM